MSLLDVHHLSRPPWWPQHSRVIPLPMARSPCSSSGPGPSCVLFTMLAASLGSSQRATTTSPSKRESAPRLWDFEHLEGILSENLDEARLLNFC